MQCCACMQSEEKGEGDKETLLQHNCLRRTSVVSKSLLQLIITMQVNSALTFARNRPSIAKIIDLKLVDPE